MRNCQIPRPEGDRLQGDVQAVDWERDDLLHLPLHLPAVFLANELSRHFPVREDYGLEFTAYVYRIAARSRPAARRAPAAKT